MEPIPYTNFWKEEPNIQKKAWRPTDEVKRKLNQFWFLQGLLLAAIVVMGALLIKESQRYPTINAHLPNGIVLETVPEIRQMDRLARMEMVNNVLQILYFQDGKENLLHVITNNIEMAILQKFSSEMRMTKATNTTVNISIAETFETGAQAGQGFISMTKAYLTKRSEKESTTAPIYINALWSWRREKFVLTQIKEVKPAVYLEAFNQEKEKIKRMTPEEMQKELGVKLEKEIKIIKRNPLL